MRYSNKPYKTDKKQRARAALRKALIEGQIKMASKCSICRKPAASFTRRLDAHHDNYNKPLDVIWVCRTCHSYITNLSRWMPKWKKFAIHVKREGKFEWFFSVFASNKMGAYVLANKIYRENMGTDKFRIKRPYLRKLAKELAKV